MKLPNSPWQNFSKRLKKLSLRFRTSLPRAARLLRAAATLLWACAPLPVLAQLAPPNDLGVSIGHIHLLVKDVVVQQKFWTEMMGGTLVANGPLSLIEFPGVFIMLRQGDPSGPPAGSTIDHFGFVVKDLAAARARWKAGNVTFEEGAENPNQGYVLAPDGIRVEVFGDPSLPGPISMDHIHSYPEAVDVPKLQEWYAKAFGGLPGKRERVAGGGLIDCDYFQRFNLSFSVRGGPLLPTKGRAIDHIGFDVRDIDAFGQLLESQGIKFDAPPRQIPNTLTKVAFLTDPWGTYIEVTQNLSPPAAPPLITAAARADLASKGKVRLGLNLGNPLYISIDPVTGERRGIAMDLIPELGLRVGAPIEIVGYNSAGEMTAGGAKGEWDVAFFPGIDPGREDAVVFSAPTMEFEITYLVPGGSTLRSIEDVDRDGVRIAVSEKSIYDLYMSRTLQRARLMRVPGVEPSYQMFMRDKLEAFAGPRTTLIAYAARMPGARVLDGKIMTGQFAIGTPKGREAGSRYIYEFNEYIKASGKVARAIANHGVAGVSVAPKGSQ